VADDYDDQDQTDLVPRSQIRQLEEKAKKAGELEARLAEMERRAAFSEALGTAATDPKVKYFIKGYDGELTPEAIRAEALEAGVLQPPQERTTDQTQNQPSSQEMAAHARMQASAEGAQGNRPIDLLEALGPRGSKKPEEITAILRQAGPGAPFRLAQDMQ
jgi:hypothetical protein